MAENILFLTELTGLKVYDLRGREIASLFEGVRPAGRYEAAFDGSGLASGVYLCSLRGGGTVSNRKMLMIE